eukprot:1209654-Amorphochlora_amoeboformis.AAC.1
MTPHDDIMRGWNIKAIDRGKRLCGCQSDREPNQHTTQIANSISPISAIQIDSERSVMDPRGEMRGL